MRFPLFSLRHGWGAYREKLYEVLGKQEIQRPIQRHTHLLLKARQLAEVNRAPQPPGDAPGEVNPQDVGYARALANGRQLANGGKDK